MDIDTTVAPVTAPDTPINDIQICYHPNWNVLCDERIWFKLLSALTIIKIAFVLIQAI